MNAKAPDVTTLLADIVAGGKQAAAQLLPLLYAELRKLARAQLSRLRPGETLQPTALVHEAYLKLIGNVDPGWKGRGHFMAAAAQAMREIIVDHLRSKLAAKRGGGCPKEELDAALTISAEDLGPEDGLAIDAALENLEVEYPRQAQVVVMRFFGGLSAEEIASALGVTTRTIERDWRFARAHLHATLSGESG